MRVTRHSFTYKEVIALTNVLRGTEEKVGLSQKQLPVGITLPLLDFLDRATRELKPFDDAVASLKKRFHEAAEEGDKTALNGEYQELLNSEVELQIYPIPSAVIDGLDESGRFDSLSLAELVALRPFLLNDRDHEYD